MFELLQSCARPSIWEDIISTCIMFLWQNRKKKSGYWVIICLITARKHVVGTHKKHLFEKFLLALFKHKLNELLLISGQRKSVVDSHLTPDNLVRGSGWLCTQNPYANFLLWLTRHPNVNKQVNSPDLLIFRQFHRHILKNRTMLFPTTFISTSEKIDVGLEKQVAIFFISVPPGDV